MPLPIGHVAIGLATSHIISDNGQRQIKWQSALLIIILANLPDIDVIFGLILQNNGSAFHRGPTHSLLFSLAGGYAVYRIASLLNKSPILSPTTCMAVVLSHIVADYWLTDAPVSFLWPFEVNWVSGIAQWQTVLHAVFFEAARDGIIVLGCAILMIAHTCIRRLINKRSRGHNRFGTRAPYPVR